LTHDRCGERATEIHGHEPLRSAVAASSTAATMDA
jgi:hypothetical protein